MTTEELVNACDPATKLAVVEWCMHHIVEHAREGGSYRGLIYERLGFGPEAYSPLLADGMTINNEFDLELKDQIIEIARQEGYEKLKPLLRLCDEPGCFKSAGCGWPIEGEIYPGGKYRQTCGEHYEK